MKGHGWFSTFENYGGPLATIGLPGAAWGDSATARLESRPFVVTGDHLRLLIGGGYYAETCYVALLDDATGLELSRIHTNNLSGMGERLWDLGAWSGQTVRLAIVDEETGPGGWIAVDGIEERLGDLAAVGESPPGGTLVTGLGAWPNPFNPQTVIRFEMAGAGAAQVEVYDLAGRRVWRSREVVTSGGEVRVAWDGRDQDGRALPSGAFVGRVVVDGLPVAQVRLMLLK